MPAFPETQQLKHKAIGERSTDKVSLLVGSHLQNSLLSIRLLGVVGRAEHEYGRQFEGFAHGIHRVNIRSK